MQNGAYTLAGLAVGVGLLLLTLADGTGVYTPLGSALLLVALVLVGLGKGIDLLGHVRDGATDPDDRR
jgi:hypothetical protein